MHRRGGQERRHRRPVRADVAVREDDDVHAALHQLGRLAAHLLHAALHALRPAAHRPGHVDRARLEHVMVHLAQLLQLRVAQDRLRHHELVAVVGRLAEQVDLRADHGLEAHHHGLADRVDRRVRDLREELLEVREQRRPGVRHRGRGEVVAHRAGGLGGVARHRREDDPQVLLRPAEGELAGPQRLHARHARAALGKVLDVDRAVARATRRRGGGRASSCLISSSGTIRSASRSTRNSLPGRRRPLAFTWSSAILNTPVSEASTTQPSCGHEPAPGAQAVAVERRADHAAVAEGHRGRAVPRLHERRVVGVEVAHLLGQLGAALEGLRHQHRDRVRGRAAAEHEQLQQAVERGGVGDVVAQERRDLLHVVAEQLRGRGRPRGRASSCGCRAAC